MARYLLSVWPFAGCIHPLIAVAHALRDRGHDCAFYTGELYRDTVERSGFRFFPFQRLDDSFLDDVVYSPEGIGRNWTRPWKWKLRPQLRTFFVDTVPEQTADIREIVAQWGVDAIVTDPALLAPFLILSEADEIPVAIVSYAGGCMLPGRGIPPNGPGLPLGRNPLGHLRNWCWRLGIDFFLADMRREANRLRLEYGLAPFRGPVIGLAERLPLYILPSCREYDYNRTDTPPCVKYVGPLQWYPRQQAPGWLLELPRDKPLVHITEGTLHHQEPFVLQAAAQGLGGLDMNVVMTTGGSRDPSKMGLGTLAANIRVERFVPHDNLLPRTDVMVTTAGGGTVMAGLEWGVPMVLVPTEWDKAENAQRVVEAGAGVRLAPGSCSPGRLRAAVAKVLGDGSYRRNARRLANLLSRCGGPPKAAELLEQLVVPTAGQAGTFAAGRS